MPFKINFKKHLIPALGVIFGIMLIVFGSFSGKKENNQTVSQNKFCEEELTTYTEALEKRIKNLIGHIGGVSDVEVLLTVETSSETVYATSGQNKDYVIVKDADGNESPVEITEICANIRGIAIVCNYGEKESVKKEIIDMLASLFNLGTNRISVVSSEENK